MSFNIDDYIKKQELWVKKNNIKVGSKVILLRDWKSDEYPIYIFIYSMMNNLIGKELCIHYIQTNAIFADINDINNDILDNSKQFYFPYFVLQSKNNFTNDINKILGIDIL